MRFGEIVEYQGLSYRAGKRNERTINVVSDDPNTLDHGFQECAPGVYVKQVLRSEIDAAYAVFNKATYRGHEFTIGSARDGQVLLSGGVAFAGWGFEQAEYGVWEKWADITEVDRIWEERVPI